MLTPQSVNRLPMLSPIAKTLLRPIHAMLDAYLERIATHITQGRIQDALESINGLRDALASLKKWIE